MNLKSALKNDKKTRTSEETINTISVEVPTTEEKPSFGRRKTDGIAKVKSFVNQDTLLKKKEPTGKDFSKVAPFVKSSERYNKAMRAKDWQQRGLIEVVPERQTLRHRILPRSVIGICFMLLALGVGAAFSGASFYAYYNNRLTDNEQTVARFVEGFDSQFNDAAGALDDLRTASIDQIRGELQPLEGYVANANGVASLPQQIGKSVWLLESRNAEGVLVAGSAYAVVGHEGGTAFVTSYSLVKASTVEPAPPIEIVKDGRRLNAKLWSWDEERDLALIVVDADVEILDLASNQMQADAVGATVFSVSGTGGQGATAAPGILIDSSQLGVQHTSPVGTLFTGGPLVNGEGKVIGMATNEYRPYGVDQGQVPQAPDVRSLCVQILQCSETSGIIDVEVGEVAVDVPTAEDGPVRTGDDAAVETGETTETEAADNAAEPNETTTDAQPE